MISEKNCGKYNQPNKNMGHTLSYCVFLRNKFIFLGMHRVNTKLLVFGSDNYDPCSPSYSILSVHKYFCFSNAKALLSWCFLIFYSSYIFLYNMYHKKSQNKVPPLDKKLHFSY